nr:hypothetical protein [Tanacetum cinerariifolium]
MIYGNSNLTQKEAEKQPTSLESQTLVATAEAFLAPTKYLETCAPISITKDFKAHLCGTQTQWNLLDDDFEIVNPKEAKKVWVRRLMERCRADWDGILESWMKPKWMRRSRVGVEKRKKVPEDVEGTSSYVIHIGRSKIFRAHTQELEKRTRKRASKVHMFERLHKINKDRLR